jgi:hypothetical protein
VRSRLRAVLLALAIVACSRPNAAAKPSGYTPKWRVGDWWVTKTWGESQAGPPFWRWSYHRYEVACIRRVDGHACFAVETRQIGPDGDRTRYPLSVFYVDKHDWTLVREPDFGRQVQLPSFPLRSENHDTTVRWLDYLSVWLREICQAGDSAEVHRLLAEGDTAGSRVVRIAGAVYQVRVEQGEELEPGPQGSCSWGRRVDGSLQLWSVGQPWRVYDEEYIDSERPKPTRRLFARTWLIASGHKMIWL